MFWLTFGDRRVFEDRLQRRQRRVRVELRVLGRAADGDVVRLPRLPAEGEADDVGPQRVEAGRLQVEREPLLLLQLLEEGVERLRRVDELVASYVPVVGGSWSAARVGRRRPRRSRRTAPACRASSWRAGGRGPRRLAARSGFDRGLTRPARRLSPASPAPRRSSSRRSASASLRTRSAKPRNPNSWNSSSSRWPSQSRRFQPSQSSGIGTRVSRRTSCWLFARLPLAIGVLERLLASSARRHLVGVRDDVVERAELLEPLGRGLRPDARARPGRCPPSRRPAPGSRPPAPAARPSRPSVRPASMTPPCGG